MESELAKRLLDQVKRWRDERGLSQEQFAEKAGMDPKHYQHVEARRKTDFRISTLERLAKGCGLAPWQMLHPEIFEAAVEDVPQAKYERSPAARKQRKLKKEK